MALNTGLAAIAIASAALYPSFDLCPGGCVQILTSAPAVVEAGAEMSPKTGTIR